MESILIKPTRILGNLVKEGEGILENSYWYKGENVGDGIEYKFETGLLENYNWLTADILLDGKFMVVFLLKIIEDMDREFHLMFAVLNQCQARIRIPIKQVITQNKWRFPREGAFLKPIVGGDIVELSKVSKMNLIILRKSEEAARFCLTDFVLTKYFVPKLKNPLTPKGFLVDEFGQSRIHIWKTKTGSEKELKERLVKQLKKASFVKFPEDYSKWGGWKKKRFEARNFFKTIFDGKRWYFVDPDGYAFWSSGLNCVRPEVIANIEGIEKTLKWLPDKDGIFKDCFSYTSEGQLQFNFLMANFIRTFGPKEWYSAWSKIILSLLKKWGFNTFGNWSDWKIASINRFPYVRPLYFNAKRVKYIFRDFPDVFNPDFEKDAEDFAKQLLETKEDISLIGYFLMNEPTWGFAKQLPAEGMLITGLESKTREKFCEFLKNKYKNSSVLSKAWKMKVDFEEICHGKWEKKLTEESKKDLEEFSTLMVKKLFETLSYACKRVDPEHLNLGARYYTIPPDWAVEGMKCFDVFSINCYAEMVPSDKLSELSRKLNIPIIIGEWHFGALDVGLPASGIGRVKNQKERGKAFRVYLETAAREFWCVGVHYFTLYDQSILGRFDGENYNIGFLDVCNRPYNELVKSAKLSHRRLYYVVSGKLPPYKGKVEYLPKLFI